MYLAPKLSGGLTCPDGQLFSQCKAHCQRKCGEPKTDCDESICRPGCVCPDNKLMWNNGLVCSDLCLLTTAAPTPAPTTTLPSGCKDKIDSCESEIDRCSSESALVRDTMMIACPWTCQNVNICGDIFTTTTATTTTVAAVTAKPLCKNTYSWMTCQHHKKAGRCDKKIYPTIADMCRVTCNTCSMPEYEKPPPPTRPPPTVDPYPDCKDETNVCKQLSESGHCKISQIARRCLKTCDVCHLKERFEEEVNNVTIAAIVATEPQARVLNFTSQISIFSPILY